MVDTLAAFGYAMGVESERDETEMTRLLHALLDVARKGPAVVLNHHVTKSQDNPRERGSGAIAATCDVILNMAARKDDETVVDVTARGRLPVQSFALQKSGGTFHLTQAGAPAAHDAKAARVLQLVTAEPGPLTSNAVSNASGEPAATSCMRSNGWSGSAFWCATEAACGQVVRWYELVRVPAEPPSRQVVRLVLPLKGESTKRRTVPRCRLLRLPYRLATSRVKRGNPMSRTRP